MDRVLQIPELLTFVFGHLDAASRLSCALVSKRWSEVALDLLWRELDSPQPLVGLLAPLVSLGTGLEFQRPIKVEDWRVFDRYARRVRSLSMNFVDGDLELSSDVYSEISQKRPSLVLLPNLTRFSIAPDTSEAFVHCLPFISRSVTELQLQLYNVNNDDDDDDVSPDDISEFLKECMVRMPNLRVFELTAHDTQPIGIVEQQVADFLSSKPTLEVFNCALYYATSRIVSALSLLPSLRTIDFNYTSKFGCGVGTQVMGFHPTISPGAFPALIDLSFSATYQDASTFMEKDFAPSLQKLCIHSPRAEDAASLHHLLALLSGRREGLVQLGLSSIALDCNEPLRDSEGRDVDIVTSASLAPLSDFPNLVHFEVTYHRPFQLSDSELEALVSNWQSLEVLHLCCDPLLDDPPTLTPSVLPAIAKCCPKLRRLSLYLETHIDDSTPLLSNPVCPPRFSSLEGIEFGTSPLEESDIPGFVLFLSDLLPITCDIDTLCGVGWILDTELESHGIGLEACVIPLWEKAAYALKMLIKAREHERSRVHDLAREARDLAMRVAVLEEQRRLGLTAIAATSGHANICVHQ